MTTLVQASGEAGFALYTYYNYVKAWVVYMEGTYGYGDNGVTKFKNRIQSLKSYTRLQTNASCSGKLTAPYGRGQLTLSAMRKLPIKIHQELALSANLWLPVQSYYAIHGVGLATLVALGQQPPKDHRAFRASFSQLTQKFFPIPFCACCTGGPQPKGFSFLGICTTPAEVAAQSNLANPNKSNEAHFIGKNLESTRKRTIDELFDKARHEQVKKGRKRRNLSKANKQSVCQRLHGTSVCDFIYRMRVRSNYDDPDMYLFASGDLTSAVTHYQNLLYLTEVIISGLEVLIEKKIGQQAMNKLKGTFS